MEKYAFGVVILTNDDTEINLYKAYVNKEYMESRNIAGELEGVKQAILWAIENKKNDITIFYDYEGIEKWATKEWKAKKKVAQDYVNFINEKLKLIKINFEQVKSHSGITYNEKADELARKALIAHGYKTYDDGSIYFVGFDENDWMNIISEISQEIEQFEDGKKIETKIFYPKDYQKILKVKLANCAITINCYRGKKSYVQGKQSPLFQRIISLAIEKLPNNGEVIEKLNSYHALTIEEAEVYNKFMNLLPNFPTSFSDTKLYNTLLSAVYNTMLVRYMPDYTCLLIPIFRTTEYYLHRILNDKLGKDTTKYKKNCFNYFSKEDNKYYYNSDCRDSNVDQIYLLNEFYNFYCQIRHPYSHWAQDSIDTHVITKMEMQEICY